MALSEEHLMQRRWLEIGVGGSYVEHLREDKEGVSEVGERDVCDGEKKRRREGEKEVKVEE